MFFALQDGGQSAAAIVAPESAMHGPTIAGIPVAFVLFALTLVGVALFHHRTLQVALIGLAAITAYKLIFTTFDGLAGFPGLAMHMRNEWVVLTNLFGLLVGFALLSDQFEKSRVPEMLPAVLPSDWRGPVVLLAMIFVLSTFLDNIAAAIIGGTIAASVFRGKVHIGYLAAIVAASNAGGSGSVVGDTTTTMMWIEGVPAMEVLHAFVPAGVALAVFSIPAALKQQAYSPIVYDPSPGLRVDWARVAIVCIVLVLAIVTNVVVNVRFTAIADQFPFIGTAVWVALLVTAPWRKPDWKLVPNAVSGAIFLLSLVTCASMMPVESLPAPSWQTTLGLGFVSAVFDNIPLTKLALEQGGYDWAPIAYAVGFGGSIIWFGSSAGVAISTRFPEARSVFAWLRHGWYVALAYVVGFAAYMAVYGFHPDPAL
jgi:Na+/H+ antiporter NhaD/arsenite permease-like protein